MAGAAHADEAAASLEHITVTSEFRQTPLMESASSITVLDDALIADEGAEHFEQLIKSVPNLNWAGGSSRPRYFQIRGVGEQEEYQGAPNASVGFMIDDIDLSGLGMGASLYDVQQVEVLRGPQGTRFGANALAGMIYVKSKDPSLDPEYGVELSGGSDDLRSLAGHASGALDSAGDLRYRLMLQQHQQDGFRDNRYLGRSDTNQRDELSARLKLQWQLGQRLRIDLAALHFNFDNGYDAWTLDNNGFDTLTDQPGTDAQRTSGASLKVTYQLPVGIDLIALTNGADSNHRHAYDGDWANPDYWADRQCTAYDDNWNPIGTEPCVYDYLWDKQGKRNTLAQELRLQSTEQTRLLSGSTDWLLGLYLGQLRESNATDSTYNGWPDVVLSSEYKATNSALFAQTDSALSSNMSLSLGARVERRDARYHDDSGEHFDPQETMWGGHIALSYRWDASQQGYLKLARGYKAGGFNMGLPAGLSQHKQFDAETLYNAEMGLASRWLDGELNTTLALFYMIRNDQQVQGSVQEANSPEFYLYTTNAAKSNNLGLELSAQWQAHATLELYGSLGLMHSAFDGFKAVQSDGSYVDMDGRELAHAPGYQASLGATWRPWSHWFFNLNGSASDAFYYSDNHNQKSAAYTLLNARIGYEADNWALYLWGKNLADTQYGVRGFYFGNEPDTDWAPALYERYGDPRSFGLTFSYHYY